jgi:hypothetical protein
LRAAAEIGQVDVVRHLLKLLDQLLIKSDVNAMFRYLAKREIEIEVLEELGISVGIHSMAQEDNKLYRASISPEAIPFPIPVFLAAVRQHEEVLALLLPGRSTDYIQELLERAQGIEVGCGSFHDYLEKYC